jgi:iron complex outermembrane receptor protein
MKKYIMAIAMTLSVGSVFAEPLQIEVHGTCQDMTPIPEGCVERLPDVVSTASPENYVVSDPTIAGSRIATKPIDDPHNVVEVSSDTIQDQGAKTLNDVMRNVSGINYNGNMAGNRSNPIIRGFVIDEHYGIKVDGMYNLTWEDYSLFNVERVDIVKGPNAAVNGMSDPGGFINYVTKKPTFGESYGEFEQSIGSRGDYTTSMSYNTELSDSLASRSVISYGDGPNPALSGNTDKERLFIDQMFTAKLSSSQTLDVDIRHQTDNQNYGAASLLPAIGNRPAPIPINSNFSSPDDKFNVNDDSIAFRLHTDLNNLWSMNNNLKYQSVDRVRQYLNPSAISNSGILTTSYYDGEQRMNYTTFDNNLMYKGDVYSMKNTLVFGIDYQNNTTTQTLQSNSTHYNINIYNPPNYSNFTWLYGPTVNSTAWQYDIGEYVQDELFLTDKWVLNTAVRHDYTPQGSSTAPDATDSATSPSIGLTYKVTPLWSVYTDYGTSFNPQTQTTTGYVPPQRSRQYESGTKYIDPVNGVSVTAAVYSLTLYNVATPDPTNSTLTDYTGAARNNGFELQAAYDVTHNWTVLANYAYIDSKITQDTNYVGNQMAGVPQNTAGGWLQYHEGVWGAGIGANYVSNRMGDNANDFVLPSYTVVNANAFYKYTNNTTFRLNINNLFNEGYYLGGTSRTAILQGTPLTVMASVNVKF